ncbi:MAG: amidohydrolase family protein [Gemmatimonadaceae bacterium]|nr:amidohydrolase family protein [Gemmatimonadaceae bacterium]
MTAVAVAAAVTTLAAVGSQAHAQSASVTRAFTGVTLFDGTARAPINNAVLLVRDGRVVAAGPESSVRIPSDARRESLRGKFVMPGLINAHGHASSTDNLATYAAYGVTTVYSLGDETPEVFAARAAQRSIAPRHARVFVAGPVLNPGSPTEAVTQVTSLASRGVDIAKIRVDDNLGTARKMTPEVYRAVIEAAHRQGLRVAVHLYYRDDALSLLDAKADFIAHSVRDQEVDDAFVQRVRDSKVCYSPTLMREVSTYVYEQTPEFFKDPFFLAHANREWMNTVSQPARQEATRTSTSAQKYKAQMPVAMRNLKRLAAAGVPIAMGTDTGPLGRFQGYFELMELELMVDAGLSTTDVLRSATQVAAQCMQIDRELGTLEPGKWADFLVLDASPLTDIRNIRKQHSVWIAGERVNIPPSNR